MNRKREDDENRLLRELVKEEREEIEILRDIRGELKPKHLAFVKIAIGGKMIGPVTLTVGDKKTATLQGFDQNGAPFVIDPSTVASVAWVMSDPALDSSTPNADNSDAIVSLSAGVANLSGTLTTTDGKTFSDIETITNVAQAPVLSSVKIDFA